MARVMELFVIVNALAGIATFVGVAWRRSKDKTKRGFDIITNRGEEDEWNNGGTKSGEISPPSQTGEESSSDSQSSHSSVVSR